MRKLHLWHKPKKYKAKVYDYYSLAYSYTDPKGKKQKHEVMRLGKLLEKEAAEYRLKLKIFHGDISEIAFINEMSFLDAKKYLDIALLNNIYEQLGLNEIFKIVSNKEIKTEDVAKILILNRCLDPQANYKTVDWFDDSYLPQIMNINAEKYNKDKIYHELSLIGNKRKILQKHFSKLSKKFNKGEFELYFFDATTSYFEGLCCPLAEPAMDKTAGWQDRVIMICLVTDKWGYPIMWDVFSGRKRDVKEFRKIANKMKNELGIKEITFCFDRGVAAAENFKLIEDELDSKYITGLKKNQIEDIFDIDKFINKTKGKIIEIYNKPREKGEKIMPINGFYQLGKCRFYKDLNVVNGKRYVISFNIQIHDKEKKLREEAITIAKEKIAELNEELSRPQKNRDSKPAEEELLKILKRNQLKKFFDYEIVPIAIKKNNDFIQSHKINFSVNNEKLIEIKKYDGILVYVTDHVEKNKDETFKVSAANIVSHYKNKYVIENAFRYLKSFTDLRPFYVYLPEHVNAHVDICMVAYFINTFIYHKLYSVGVSLEEFYSLIESYSRICKLDTGTGHQRSLLKTLSKEVTGIISKLGASSILSPKYLEKLGIQK